LVEQDCLRVAVSFHGSVKIQMLGCEIGEDTGTKPNRLQLSQRQRMGGSLHHRVLHSAVGKFPQTAVQLIGVRRGHGAVHGSDQPTAVSRLFQNRTKQIRGRGLSVGTRHGDHVHAIRRIAVVI